MQEDRGALHMCNCQTPKLIFLFIPKHFCSFFSEEEEGDYPGMLKLFNFNKIPIQSEKFPFHFLPATQFGFDSQSMLFNLAAGLLEKARNDSEMKSWNLSRKSRACP